MNEYDRLRKQFEEETFLVADATADVRLATRPQLIHIMSKKAGETVTVQNLTRVLKTFVAEIGSEDREFSQNQIAAIMGVTQQMVSNYRASDVLIPSVVDNRTRGSADPTRYSWQDAFVARCISSLRRHLGTDVLRQIQPLVMGQKKRTPQRAVTRRES